MSGLRPSELPQAPTAAPLRGPTLLALEMEQKC